MKMSALVRVPADSLKPGDKVAINANHEVVHSLVPDPRPDDDTDVVKVRCVIRNSFGNVVSVWASDPMRSERCYEITHNLDVWLERIGAVYLTDLEVGDRIVHDCGRNCPKESVTILKIVRDVFEAPNDVVVVHAILHVLTDAGRPVVFMVPWDEDCYFDTDPRYLDVENVSV